MKGDLIMTSNYTGVGFVSSLPFRDIQPFLVNKIVPDTTSARTGLASEGILPLDAFFQSNFINGTGNSIPITWDQFIAAYRTYQGTSNPDPRAGAAWDAFLGNFVAILGSDLTGGGDLASLTANGVNVSDMFINAFNKFIQTYPFTAVNNYGDATNFFTNWSIFLTQVAFLKNATNGQPPGTFENIYNAYFPADTTNLNNNIQTLYNESLNKDGLFLPSQDYGAFLTQIAAAYSNALNGSPSTTTTSTGGVSNSEGALVIKRVILLLIQLLNSIQSVASAQAQRLGFNTTWANAYTNLLSQVRTFTANGPEQITDADIRTDLNTNTNQTYITEIQARRDVITNDTKALQSAVNNSQDALQNASSGITAFLQQLSSITSSIYR
jgi:hypothetical protein